MKNMKRIKKNFVKGVISAIAFLLLTSICVSCDRETPFSERELETMDIYNDGYNNNMIVGFDEYGRTVSSAAGEKSSREIGIFYFVWLGYPLANDVYDVSKIIEEYGKDEVFKNGDSLISPVGQAHFWGKPLYGYYNSLDRWVLRRHMEMLTDAGCDFLIFDTTNCVLYEQQVKRIMEISCELRAAGWDAPQVCFYTHSRSIQTIENIYKTFYCDTKYEESWYKVNGRPMIIGYTDAEKDIAEALSRGETTYRPEDLSQELQDFFYIKEACWPNDEHNENSFPYTEWTYPQPLNGNTMNVSVATHPMVPFSFSLTRENWCNWGRGYNVETGENVHGDIYKGTFFQSQWETVFEAEPEMIMITGWNEWVAYKQLYDGEYMLCDNADLEYSRDIEPMEGGYEDAYYIQMCMNIKEYKYNSAENIIAENVSKTVDISGPDSQWDEVKATYRRANTDNSGRKYNGAAKTVKYETPAAENNILSVKVTNDNENLYLRIECGETVTVSDEANFMNVFIGTDTPSQKGWESYEYAVNRSRSGGSASVEKLSEDFSGTKTGEASICISGNCVYFKIPMVAVGTGAAGNNRIYFKVADGVEDTDEIMNYYITGMSLPMGRLSYEYKFTVE